MNPHSSYRKTVLSAGPLNRDHPGRSSGVGQPHSTIGSTVELTAELLCVQYSTRVYRFAAMVSTSAHDAEDLAQTALERAIRALPRFDPRRGDVEGWLWRIVANAAGDARRGARRRRLLVELLVRRADRLAYQAPPETADDVLLTAVRRLPDRQRAAIALRYGADLDLRAVGATLGVSVAGTSILIRRALERLRAELSEEEK
jgi:RNA polymerase sigma factor (sigma-70 family)